MGNGSRRAYSMVLNRHQSWSSFGYIEIAVDVDRWSSLFVLKLWLSWPILSTGGIRVLSRQARNTHLRDGRNLRRLHDVLVV